MVPELSFIQIPDSMYQLSLSDFLPISTGVPQGSILGPLLSSVYVNDLPQSLKKCKVDSYVDDTKMCLSFNATILNLGV